MADEVVDIEVARQKMRQWRDEPLRNSEEVVEFGECLLLEHGNKLGDELWTIYEQVFLASLDCGKLDLATMCLKELNTQFPGSMRVKKLKGMRLEALERYEDAEKIYDKILEAEPANSVAYKRKIAILKSQNKIPEAIKELNEYLKKFMSDQEAWMELIDLYISLQDLRKAKFCMEELILANPHNHLYHQRFAEILYTIGDLENMEKSRKYFAQSLKLDNDNLRALYGFFLSASHLSSFSKDSKAKRENAKYASWAGGQIMERYQSIKVGDGQEEDNMLALGGMIDSLQINTPQNIPS
ncbi:ER membrane protein complex subunit 2-like [Actinia tenebrosa]|uniref:ER membrane protein complex subunit 2 n=1 Tax=Actinia tenebrosa TaxID=6105 RepID=A0A6P8IIZ3_ACTTE|nr:ER membrane protein complex subunit 2-like [Actinia tenebrosa]